MIKGDKVICIKDYNASGWLSKNDSITKGQVYEVSYCERSGIHYNDNLVAQPLFNEINKINLKEKGNVNYPIELFITIDQWREQQINKLIDER